MLIQVTCLSVSVSNSIKPGDVNHTLHNTVASWALCRAFSVFPYRHYKTLRHTSFQYQHKHGNIPECSTCVSFVKRLYSDIRIIFYNIIRNGNVCGLMGTYNAKTSIVSFIIARQHSKYPSIAFLKENNNIPVSLIYHN